MRCAPVAAVVLGGLITIAAGCARESKRATPPRVEAVFDVPREYRLLGTLPCAESSALVYLVTAEGDLHGFRPDALTFHHVGRLRCPAAPGATPISMAVDRAGTAWIHYSDGSLHRASTRDARCVATGFGVQHSGFFQPGMAFVSTGPDLIEETLFLWAGTSVTGPFTWRGSWAWTYEEHGLARLDRATLALELVGYGEPRGGGAHVAMGVTGDGAFVSPGNVRVEINGGGSMHDGTFFADRGGTIRIGREGSDAPRLDEVAAELTGTGDGKLYGFFRTAPATLAEIDPATGRVIAPRKLPGINRVAAWAFSFWGGDFYLYWARARQTSHVTRVSGRDGSLQELLRDVGFRIVGAGVSTCAPLTR